MEVWRVDAARRLLQAPPGSAPASSASGSPESALLGSSTDSWGPVVTVVVIAIFDVLTIALHDRSPVREWLSKCLPCLRWRHWPFTFISNMRDGLPRDTRPQTFWALDVLDPVHLVTSFCVPSWVLLLLHLLCFAYFIAYVVLDVAYYYNQPPPDGVDQPYWEWLTFLTNWSIMFYALASFLAAVNTLRFILQTRRRRVPHGPQLATSSYTDAVAAHHGAGVVPTGSSPAAIHPADVQTIAPGQAGMAPYAEGNALRAVKAEEGRAHDAPATAPATAPTTEHITEATNGAMTPVNRVPLHQPEMRWDWLSIAHLLTMETFTTASWFVGFWYWVGLIGVVGGDASYNEATTYMPHGGSAILAAFQILLTRMPIVSHHYPLLVLYANLYLILLWIYGEVTGTWRYGLDWHRARPVGAFILIMPALFLWFSIWYLIAKLRRQACISRLHHPPVKYTLDSKGRPTGRVKAVPANKFPAQNLEPAGDTADAATNQDTHSVDGVAGPTAHTSDGGDGGVGGVAPSAPPALYGPGGPSGYDNTPSAPSAPPAYDNGNRQAGHASNGGGVAGRDVEMPPVRS